MTCLTALGTSVATLALGLALGAAPVAAGPVPQPLALTVSGSNGVNRLQDPGRRCADGGSGQYRHQSVEAPLPAGVLSAALPGVVRAFLDVHHDGQEPVGTPLTGAAATAFLQGTESHATMSNQRGSVQVRLASGSCPSPSLAFDGTTVSGGGTWAVDPASTTGSYTGTTGTGTFTLSTGVEPGADNTWSLSLNGSLSVPQPHLKAEVVSTSWGNLGVDYVSRRVTVTYRVTNDGTGDAFAAVLTNATSPTSGVTPLGPVPQSLGDLPAGRSAVVSVRYQLGLLAPCALVILGCRFSTVVTVSLPDALDKATTPPASVTLPAKAPDLPPPL